MKKELLTKKEKERFEQEDEEQERFNEIAEIILRLLIVTGIISFIVLAVFTFDLDNNEMGKVFCEKEYGGEFAYKYDKNLHYNYCGIITKNGTLIKYYLNDEYIEKYCENKFWKLDDCENGLFK